MRRSPSIPVTSLAVVLLASLGGAAGCGGAAVRAAERGDARELRAALATRHDRGAVSNGEAACLARAVVARELLRAKDEAAAVARVRESRACAAELDDALEERSQTHDGAGAEAALARLEDGRLDDGRAREHLSDPDDRWRAVGARTLHQEGDRARRQSALLDPSPRVRRSAMRAAAEARDAADLDLLFDSARLDPELLLRNEALRAMSQILRAEPRASHHAHARTASRAGEHVNRLRDLWTSGDDALREDVAVAWALSPVFESGGREALRVEIASGRGPGAIAAAGVILRTARSDEELTSSARALLARVIEEGKVRDRVHAIALTELEGQGLEALKKAARDEDREVRVPALGRLLASRSEHDAARQELVALAGQGVKGGPPSDDPRVREAAARARAALAQAGDAAVQAWIEQDLAAKEPAVRLGAASALAALGRPARAVLLLADEDPSVRTRAACTMLAASRR